jgi:hypothetical protein
MKTVFTICSNNYLAQAKALGDSLIKHNPKYQLIIGLVDKLSENIDYSFFNPYEIIPIEELGIEGFDEMSNTYEITELNTAVKPFIFHFLFKRDTAIESIVYFDPDIFIYKPLDELENCLIENNIVLTPHFFTTINDDFRLSEPDILNAGLYNLGFIAVKRSDETEKFLKWWMTKLKKQCLIDLKNGLFVDQLWINFVPLYFEKVYILKHLGYNVAYWNLHERQITKHEDVYFVNQLYPLVFYHFSGYNFEYPEKVSKHQNRFNFDQRQDIAPLFQDYHQTVIANNFEELSKISCHYILPKKIRTDNSYSYRDLLYLFRQKLKGEFQLSHKN